MKKIFFLSLLHISIFSVIAQAPKAFKYQAVVRDNSGEVLQNQTIGIRITIHYQSAVGEIAYQETFTETTNDFGLVSLEIGTGIPTIGSFESVSWGGSSKFLELEIDPNGGALYTSIGTSELLSVPFALYSERAWNAPWERSGNKFYYNEGNIGIGTSDPVNNLDVRSEEADGGAVSVGNSDLSHRLLLFSGGEDNPNPYLLWSHSDSLRFGTNEGGFTERMRIASNGNVGIGTSNPLNLLHVAGDMRLDESSPYLYFYNGDSQLAFIGFWTPTSDLNFFNKTTSGSLKFGTDSYERMRINENGNVGIGTTNPASYKLDVNGMIRSIDGIQINGWENSGIYISEPLDQGVQVNWAGNHGFMSHAAGNDGLYVVSAVDDGIYVNDVGDDGVYIEDAGDDGLHVSYSGGQGVYVDHPGSYGVWVQNAGNAGIVSHTDVANGHGFFTINSTYSSGGYYPAKSGTFAKNIGMSKLEPGDLICISGGYEENVLGEGSVPVVNITKANDKNSQSIFGIVEYQIYIHEEIEVLDNGETLVHKSFRYKSGKVNPDDYLSVIVFGIADVKVDPSENFKSGESLTAGDGFARKVQTREFEGITVAENKGILGKALEDSNGKDKIKVFVNCK